MQIEVELEETRRFVSSEGMFRWHHLHFFCSMIIFFSLLLLFLGKLYSLLFLLLLSEKIMTHAFISTYVRYVIWSYIYISSFVVFGSFGSLLKT